jgi:hypothetical protein
MAICEATQRFLLAFSPYITADEKDHLVATLEVFEPMMVRAYHEEQERRERAEYERLKKKFECSA